MDDKSGGVEGGRFKKDERERFILALRTYGKDWP